MVTIAGTREPFDIGRVFSTMFSIIGGNAVALFGFALMINIVVTSLSTYEMYSALAAAASSNSPQAMFSAFASPGYWGSVILSMIGLSVVGAGIVHGAIQGRQQGADSIGDCLQGGIRFALPMIGLTFVWYVAVTFASMLFLVPGLILMTVWSVSVPALVAERKGVFGSLKRSRTLTKDIRWAIFGTLLVFLIGYMVLIGVIQQFSPMGGFTAARTTSLASINIPAAIAVAVVGSTLGSVLINTFLAALYIEVKRSKEGKSGEQLAEIFA